MTATDTRAPETEEGEEPAAVAEAPPAKKRSNLVPAIVIAVGLVVGGFLMKPSAPPAEGEAAKEEEEVVPGEMATIEPITLNLADGHYLRLGVGIELVEGVPAKEFLEGGDADRFKDLMISEVGDMTIEQVSTTEGRTALKATLRHGAEKLYEDEFVEIYLTEAVVQ
jgi:flagellar FliL protein